MPAFETIIIFDGNLTEAEIESKEKEYFHKILHGGDPSEDTIPTTVHEIKGMGKKNLAYPIKVNGKECTSGWYTVFTYRTSPERIPQLERLMRVDNHVLKFLTMKLGEEEASKIPPHHIEEDTIHKVETPKEIDAFDLIFN